MLRLAVPEVNSSKGQLFIFDSGWAGLEMVLALVKLGFAVIVHIKNSFAGFPKDALEEQLRGMPGGSHLEMRITVEGVNLIAIGSKYNSSKTSFHLLSEGAAPTTEGEPYVSQWADEHRNVLTRDVFRPAAVSRYFMTFNFVDIHDQRRQHELGLETKWVAKGEDAGKFRILTTIKGVCAIDTMLFVQSHSHVNNPIRELTTHEFIERLAEELIDNEFDGKVSRPKKKTRTSLARKLETPEVGPVHQLHVFGRISDVRALREEEKNKVIQLRCHVCSKKASTYCAATGCANMPVCNSPKRNCFVLHCQGVPRGDSRA